VCADWITFRFLTNKNNKKTRREIPSQAPKIAGKLRSLVVAMTGGEYGAEDARKLFEALCQGIDASTYDAPLHTPR
jgi:hypothetical protein